MRGVKVHPQTCFTKRGKTPLSSPSSDALRNGRPTHESSNISPWRAFPCHSQPAPTMGLEPTVSSLTGKRLYLLSSKACGPLPLRCTLAGLINGRYLRSSRYPTAPFREKVPHKDIELHPVIGPGRVEPDKRWKTPLCQRTRVKDEGRTR